MQNCEQHRSVSDTMDGVILGLCLACIIVGIICWWYGIGWWGA